MTYLLQWSEQQQQFHVESAESNTDKSIMGFMAGIEDTYITLALVPTSDAAYELSLKLAAKRGLIWKEEEMRWIKPDKNKNV